MNKETFIEYVSDTYGVTPDCPFTDDYVSKVFRHPSNRKWFALLMEIGLNKLSPDKKGEEYVINLKCEPAAFDLRKKKGVYPAYHMNKEHWITVVLKEAEEEDIKFLTDISFNLTLPKTKGGKRK